MAVPLNAKRDHQIGRGGGGSAAGTRRRIIALAARGRRSNGKSTNWVSAEKHCAAPCAVNADERCLDDVGRRYTETAEAGTGTLLRRSVGAADKPRGPARTG